MIKPIAVELSGHIKSQLPIETFSACVSLDNLKPKALNSVILGRTYRRYTQPRRQSAASVLDPCSAAYQIPFGVPRRDVPEPDDFIIVNGNEGRLGVKTSRVQRRFERVRIWLQRNDIVRKRGKHGAMQSTQVKAGFGKRNNSCHLRSFIAPECAQKQRTSFLLDAQVFEAIF